MPELRKRWLSLAAGVGGPVTVQVGGRTVSGTFETVDDGGYLVGAITDGDLRRHMEEGLDHVASEFMTQDPKTIAPDALVDDALALFDEHRITALFVVQREGERQRPLGVLHIHDCPSAR